MSAQGIYILLSDCWMPFGLKKKKNQKKKKTKTKNGSTKGISLSDFRDSK